MSIADKCNIDKILWKGFFLIKAENVINNSNKTKKLFTYLKQQNNFTNTSHEM